MAERILWSAPIWESLERHTLDINPPDKASVAGNQSRVLRSLRWLDSPEVPGVYCFWDIEREYGRIRMIGISDRNVAIEYRLRWT